MPGHFGAKNRYIVKQVQITRQEPFDWPKRHCTCFWLEKARVHIGFVYFVYELSTVLGEF